MEWDFKRDRVGDIGTTEKVKNTFRRNSTWSLNSLAVATSTTTCTPSYASTTPKSILSGSGWGSNSNGIVAHAHQQQTAPVIAQSLAQLHPPIDTEFEFKFAFPNIKNKNIQIKAKAMASSTRPTARKSVSFESNIRQGANAQALPFKPLPTTEQLEVLIAAAKNSSKPKVPLPPHMWG